MRNDIETHTKKVVLPSEEGTQPISTPTPELPASADMFQVMDFCTDTVNQLVEYTKLEDARLLCSRLEYGLKKLSALHGEDLPPHIIEKLTAEIIPEPCVPDCWHDSHLMVDYSLALTSIFIAGNAGAENEKIIAGMLHDFAHLISDYLKQPCFEVKK